MTSAVPHKRSATYSDLENPGGFSHVPALDGIRGLAIVLVLIEHLLWSNNHTGSRIFDLIECARNSTYVGVNLFFALSGFLITGILVDTVNLPHYFKNFYGRRCLRIFPLYYGFLLVLFLLTKPLHFAWSGWQYYYLTYTANLAFLSHNGGLYLGRFNINHFWSLQVEEQFYLVWPLVLYRVRRMGSRVRICLITCILILFIRSGVLFLLKNHVLKGQYMTSAPTFCCADNLLFGCCLAVLIRTHWREEIFRISPLILSICGSILLGFSIPNRGLDCWPGTSPIASDLIQTLGFSLIGISCTALIAMALRPATRTQRIFTNSTLRFFGKYSYGIYVFHYSISGLVTQPLRFFFNEHTHSKAISVLTAAGIVTALSVLTALLSYHLYEVHLLRLKRYFSYKRSAAPPVSADLG